MKRLKKKFQCLVFCFSILVCDTFKCFFLLCLCALKTFFICYLSCRLLRWMMKCFLCLVMMVMMRETVVQSSRKNQKGINSETVFMLLSLSISWCVFSFKCLIYFFSLSKAPRTLVRTSFSSHFQRQIAVCPFNTHTQSKAIWFVLNVTCVSVWKMIIIVSPKSMTKVFENLMFNFVSTRKLK